jgi:hypothetical protein
VAVIAVVAVDSGWGVGALVVGDDTGAVVAAGVGSDSSVGEGVTSAWHAISPRARAITAGMFFGNIPRRRSGVEGTLIPLVQPLVE